MLFPTIDFAIFFGIVFVGNWLLAPFPKRWRVFILIASYVFYGWWDWRFVFLLAISTVCTIAGGRLVHRARGEVGAKGVVDRHRRCRARPARLVQVRGLAERQRRQRSAPSRAGRPRPVDPGDPPGGDLVFHLHGPVVCDRHLPREPRALTRGWTSPSSWPSSPTSSQGRSCAARTCSPRSVGRTGVTRAASRFRGPPTSSSAGLFKKVVLSSYISSQIVDPVFANPHTHSSLEVLFAVYGYAVQIYCDFSGYTDIAIGCALLLGFRFPENFNAPYMARSLQDFWRRWHMTLSSWLRDYLYIPLGGNHGSRPMMYRNIMITMVLGGLWHGAAWTFVAWGALHGIGPVRGPLQAREARGGGFVSPARRPLVARLAAFRDLSARLCGMGLLPGDLVLQRLCRLRSPLHGLDATVSPREFRGDDHPRGRHRVSICAERDAPARARGVLPP